MAKVSQGREEGKGFGAQHRARPCLQHALSPFFAAGLFVHPGTAFLALPAFLGHGFPGAPEAQKHQLPRPLPPPHPGRLQ